MRNTAAIQRLLTEQGGSEATRLGIVLDDLRPEEIFKWLLAALLFGARISPALAARTWGEFARCKVLTPQGIGETGWNGLVGVLDRGGYARYDFKTATKLLEVSERLLEDYGGDLNALHAAADDAEDLQRRVMALSKGVGPVTAGIFLRELRGRWPKAEPPLSPPALEAARQLGLLPHGYAAKDALAMLQTLWRHAGYPASRFCDFEAALVRAGLQFRRARRRGCAPVGSPDADSGVPGSRHR